MHNLKYYSDRDFPAYLPKLNQLYDDLFAGGKGFRALLTQRVAEPLGLDPRLTLLLCQTIEFIHNASLLHDDLVDRSSLRRGKTAAWLKYTPEYAVLAGDYLLARVMTNLSSHGNIALVQITSQTIAELLEGEWIQDSLVGDFDLSFDQLTQVHSLKTGSLFRWCMVAPLVAGQVQDPEVHNLMAELGSTLGLLFQRSDDLLDYDIRNGEGKAILGDIKSGYLNSFGAFFCQGLDSSVRRGLAKIESLEQIYRIVGESHFQSRLKDFDSLNQEMIDLYQHKLKELAERWPGAKEPLIENLKDLPDLLYWRQVGKRG